MKKMIRKYRNRTIFDKFARVSHPNDCYPGNCSITGYIRDGKLVYEEQTGKYPVVDPNTPDWNPAGCARQCSYAVATYGEERIKQPMMQVGRGSGRWIPISWDQAYKIIADKLLDAVLYNPQSIIYEIPPGEGGPMYSQDPFVALVTALGGVCFDLESAVIQDLSAGLYETFGKYQFASTWDDFFYSDLILIWNVNPAYSRQEKYHFLTESRYRGAEIAVIAPDYSPSAVHADYYIPVKPATDAALALAMCKVIIDENLADCSFIKEQTDLPLLVRMDTKRFLRESDFTGENKDEDEPVVVLRDKSENFYFWDKNKGLVKAPRETLALGDLDPMLEGSFKVEINGKEVEVKPVFELLKEKLKDYTPEKAQEICGVHADVIRMLARKVASGRTSILLSWNTAKMFHGDLVERAMCLLLALTGNWGKNGTGIRSWCVIYEPLALGGVVRSDELIRESVRSRVNRNMTEEELEGLSQHIQFQMFSQSVPSAFFWYRHAGYGEIWDKLDLTSAGIPRKIGEYIKEAVEKRWFEYMDLPKEEAEPRVFFIVANNTLRNKPMTRLTYLKKLWSKLDLIVCVDYRWSQTALYSDIVLPATFHHEKMQFQSLPNPETRFWAFAGKAVEPCYGAKDEITIVSELTSKIVERAKARGLTKYRVPHGVNLEKIKKLIRLEKIGLELVDVPEDIAWIIGPERDFDTLSARVMEALGRMK
ncbi:MAG: molybdopterin-dependent oxidoreductase, partial [Archaeoglobaceae archaeon]